MLRHYSDGDHVMEEQYSDDVMFLADDEEETEDEEAVEGESAGDSDTSDDSDDDDDADSSFEA